MEQVIEFAGKETSQATAADASIPVDSNLIFGNPEQFIQSN
jgi:hypothetical protein